MKSKQSFFQKYIQGPRSLIAIIIFFLLALAVLARFSDTIQTPFRLTYAAFLEKAEKGEIKKVTISGQNATGQFSDGKTFEATVIPTDEMWSILRKQHVDFSVEEDSRSNSPLANLSFWLFIVSIALGIGYAIYLWRRISKGSGGNNNSSSNIFNVGKSRAKINAQSQTSTRFSDVAGASEAKESLQDVIDYLKNPDQFKQLGARAPRGVLLVGDPGNGKTLLAKAVAGEVNCQFFSISGSDFIEVFVGVGAARIRDLFEQARRAAPSIIFIDEIDTIGRQRGTGLGGGHDEREQTLNQLLAEMDGFNTEDVPVVVLAATNLSETLDKALLRPGRFDRQVLVPYPDLEARKQLFTIALRKIKAAKDVNIAELADLTAGFTGADVANLANQATVLAVRDKKVEVTHDYFMRAYALLKKSQQDGGGDVHVASKTSHRARMYMPSQIKITFKDVAGVLEAKEELTDVVDFLRHPDKYRKLGATLTRGVLLVGDPGNGKTLLAKAVAGEANCPFYSVSASEFVEMYVGVGAARVRDLFTQARKHGPSIIFIDEIDAIGSKRMNATGGGDEYNQTLNQLLIEMDGFDSSSASIVVLAATNRPDILDAALLRPGRFDRRVDVPYPDLKSRESILRLHAKKIVMDDSINFEKLARGTPGFSAAYLANLVNEAAIDAARNNQEIVTLANFDEARDKIILGKALKSITLTPKDIKETAIHEAGHALIILMTPEIADPLYKVTVIPRGKALGVTHSMPERERHNKTKAQLENDIMVALGGRIAEEIVLGATNVSTGAFSDLRQATKIAHYMVCSYGMSELGFIMYDDREHELSYAPATAQLIDQQVKKIIDQCYAQAQALLTSNASKITLLTDELVAKETLFAREIYTLLNITPRTDHSLSSDVSTDM